MRFLLASCCRGGSPLAISAGAAFARCRLRRLQVYRPRRFQQDSCRCCHGTGHRLQVDTRGAIILPCTRPVRGNQDFFAAADVAGDVPETFTTFAMMLAVTCPLSAISTSSAHCTERPSIRPSIFQAGICFDVTGDTDALPDHRDRSAGNRRRCTLRRGWLADFGFVYFRWILLSAFVLVKHGHRSVLCDSRGSHPIKLFFDCHLVNTLSKSASASR